MFALNEVDNIVSGHASVHSKPSLSRFCAEVDDAGDNNVIIDLVLCWVAMEPLP